MVKMTKKRKKDIRIFIIDALFLLFTLILVFVLKDEIMITFLVIALVIATLYHHYVKQEFTLFLVGTSLGFFFEFIGDHFYKLQYWSEGLLGGIPLWLPLFWGYLFIMIHRLGNVIVKK